MLASKHIVVAGGQYGSEGKASAAEFWARRFKAAGYRLTVIGENSPSSGHTCSLGATKNLPATSHFADAVMLGPDTVVDPELTLHDWEATGRKPLFIHENAAVITPKVRREHAAMSADLVSRISSTGSGSNVARMEKFIRRLKEAVVRPDQVPFATVCPAKRWEELLKVVYHGAAIFECSQGMLLDTNLGRFPFCSSRTTHPRAAIERNGLGWIPWDYAAVYRTFPIRTGGPSGPTGAQELSWRSVGRQPEITTVTKRVRRVFEFSREDFLYSIGLIRPDFLMFTFLDYLEGSFADWVEFFGLDHVIKRFPVFTSSCCGQFSDLCQTS